jgi:SAM-dependent methyltransferase
MDDLILAQQLAYYRARAAEYEEWFLRQGRYDRGPALNARWFAEVGEVAAALDRFGLAGDMLELACGTGLWTERLLPHARSLTAVDASPEVIALNRGRLGSADVTYVHADLFQWEPPASSYDVVFFSFWVSHVPPERFEAFWRLVARALRPRGRFFLIDSRREPSSTAVDHRLPDRSAVTQSRRLNNGREFEIYKIYYEPDHLTGRLESLGWSASVSETPTYFLYATGQRVATECEGR